MKRYVLELARNAGLLVGGLGVFALCLFGICGMCLGFPRDAIIALCVCMACMILVYVVMMLQAIPFALQIRRQEAEGLTLDEEVHLVDRGLTGTYLGSNWLIHAGHVALHHSRISSVKSKIRFQGSVGSNNYICVTAVDGRQYCWVMSSNRVKEVRAWLKQHQQSQQTA